jgi:hypothetical protein
MEPSSRGSLVLASETPWFEPEVPELGALELCDVYEYYDGAVLFSCRSAAGRLFFVSFVEEEAGARTWLYVVVSEGRLKEIEANRVSLRDAVRGADEVLAVTLTSAGWKARPIAPADVPDAWLPEQGIFLDLVPEPVR